MEIETIKAADKRWRKGDADSVEGLIELAQCLAEARRDYQSTNDFGIWLEKNDVIIHRTDQAALIHLGEDLLLKKEISDECLDSARREISETKSRSPRIIWKILNEKRCTRAGTSDSAKSKTDKKKAGRPRTREADFAPKLLAAIRRKRKEANDVRITRKWRPEAVNKIMLHDLLDAVEQFLDDFINHRKISFEIIEAIKRDPRAAERSIDYVAENECGTGKFDA